MSFNWAASIYVHRGIAQCAVDFSFDNSINPQVGLRGRCYLLALPLRLRAALFCHCFMRAVRSAAHMTTSWTRWSEEKPRGGAGNAHKVRLHARLKVWTRLWFWPISKSPQCSIQQKLPGHLRERRLSPDPFATALALIAVGLVWHWGTTINPPSTTDESQKVVQPWRYKAELFRENIQWKDWKDSEPPRHREFRLQPAVRGAVCRAYRNWRSVLERLPTSRVMWKLRRLFILSG